MKYSFPRLASFRPFAFRLTTLRLAALRSTTSGPALPRPVSLRLAIPRLATLHLATPRLAASPAATSHLATSRFAGPCLAAPCLAAPRPAALLPTTSRPATPCLAVLRLTASRLAAFLFLLALSPVLAKAQSSKPSSELLKDWNIDAGLTVAHPLRYMNMFSGMGIGADGSITHPFSSGLSVGGRVNYAWFFGRKSEEAGFLDGATRFPAANMINILGDAHYMLPGKILFGVDLGLGMILYNGATSNSFAKIFYAGYQWDQGAHIYTFSLYFDQTTYQKNLGLRAAIRL